MWWIPTPLKHVPFATKVSPEDVEMVNMVTELQKLPPIFVADYSVHYVFGTPLGKSKRPIVKEKYDKGKG